jgi:hypothetical protein
MSGCCSGNSGAKDGCCPKDSSCSRGKPQHMFNVKQIWSAIKLPVELATNFKEIDAYWNGFLMTPSFVFGEIGSGDYDLLDGLLVFCNKIKPRDIVNIVWKNSKYIYCRNSHGWELTYTLER